MSMLCYCFLFLDYVYFETSSTSPYQIRRIEELNKTASGNVEAKVMCFYRRRDLPNQLIQLADKHQCKYIHISLIYMKNRNWYLCYIFLLYWNAWCPVDLLWFGIDGGSDGIRRVVWGIFVCFISLTLAFHAF